MKKFKVYYSIETDSLWAVGEKNKKGWRNVIIYEDKLEIYGDDFLNKFIEIGDL